MNGPPPDDTRGLLVDDPSALSPFADPHYGREAEDGHHVIKSNPRWSLEENQSNLTGWLGASVIFGSAYFLSVTPVTPRLPDMLATLQGPFNRMWDHRYAWVMFGVFLVMFLAETLIFKVHRRHFDFSRPRTLDVDAWRRIFVRFVALCTCLVGAWALYCYLGEYSFFHNHPYPETFFYSRWYTFLSFALKALAGLSLPYFWMVERYARHNGPTDEFLVLGYCLRRALRGLFLREWRADGVSAIKNPHVKNLFLGLFVKFFFTALMFTWTLNCWRNWETNIHHFLYERDSMIWSDPHHIAYMLRGLHNTCMTLIICVDLTIGTIGYMTSMRLLDTQTTSAEPTLFGWVTALLCYPPINAGLTSVYFFYGSNEAWVHHTIDSPVLSICASLVILTSMGIYAWATIVFGLRFSNLTNRGILCKGPYEWVRHPAYISKNTAWWLEALPFLAGGRDWRFSIICCAHLFTINMIYMLRAFTEEWHLNREDHYLEYKKRVPWRFIPGIF